MSSIARAEGYPEATLDQATCETISSLRIDRYQGLDEGALQAEYEWSLDMASLCLAAQEAIRGRPKHWIYAIEFQRHAGRTARYRGFAHQAIEDYRTAVEYVYETAHLNPDLTIGCFGWETCILRDIADTYLMIGAREAAEQLSKFALERERFGAKRPKHPQGNPADWDRLAKIAQEEKRFSEAVRLQRQAVTAQEFHIAAFLDSQIELGDIGPGQSWSDLVRHPAVQEIIFDPAYVGGSFTNQLRQVYWQLGRALRLDGRLNDAQTALETAELTPWECAWTWRPRLDLYVDREWAWLASDRNEPEEALGRAQTCLDKYVMNHLERVELLDLVSRAMEGLGDLQGAFDKLQEAITIVENRRANLIQDENKQLFVASYAPLYRRALALVIRIDWDGPADSEVGRYGADAIEESFEWSERVKARAMLDSLNRYGRRMAVAVALGDPEAMRHVRDLSGRMVSIEGLRQSPWWPEETALLEYTYGPGSEIGISLQRGDGSLQRGAGARIPSRTLPVYLWVVTAKGASFQRLAASAREVDQNCAALTEALGRHDRRDESWVKPASWLYERTIAPVASELRGIKRLIVVGDGKLCTVPFEVFVAAREAYPNRYVKHRLLIEDYAIAYAPSATLLDTISRRPRPESWTCSLWAFASTRFRGADMPPEAQAQPPRDPYEVIMRSARSLSLDDLLHADDEVKQLERLFGSAPVKLFIDEPDMKTQLLSASEAGTLGSTRFLHFATHAVNDPGRPYLSGLFLCPPYPGGSERKPGTQDADANESAQGEEAAPPLPRKRVTTMPTEKPWARKVRRPELLTVGELAGLDLRSDLVVLSACHSLGQMPIDGDWLYGLTRAFLIAGSSGVVCTTSDIPDQAALSMVPALYHALLSDEEMSVSGVDVAQALQQLKVARLASPRHGHPSLWASWVYHGRLPAN